MRRSLFILFFLILTKPVYCDITTSQYVVIHDLSYSWQIYDEDFEGYIPYISSKHQNVRTVSFWLDVNRFRNYHLIYQADKGQVLFINQKLCNVNTVTGLQVLSLDSLYDLYQKDKLFISFYDKKRNLPLQSVFIGKLMNQADNTYDANVSNPINKTQLEKKKNLDDIQNFIIIITLILLIFYAVLRNFYPRFFKLYHSLLIHNFSAKRLNSGVTYSHPIFSTSFLFIILSSLLIGLFYTLFQNQPFTNWDIMSYLLNQKSLENILGLTYKFLATTGIVLIFLLCKFLLLLFMGLPLKNKNLLNLHFYEYIRLSNLVYIILNVTTLVIFFSQISWTSSFFSIFYYFIAILHFLQSLSISYQVAKYFSFKSLYLFYYLCITELTPLLIGIKFLLLN